MNVPHVETLGFVPQDGTIIHVLGCIPHNCNGFHINLSVAPALNQKCETPLHLNPRFEGTNQIVRNSFLSGHWGGEERNGGFPFIKGSTFECIILCTALEYRIAFNGAHFCTFKHRTPMIRVQHVVVEGNVNLTSVTFSGPGATKVPTRRHPPKAAGCGAPQPAYGAPQPAYGAPQASAFAPPQPAYGAAPPPYGAPQHGYGPPQPPMQVLTVPMKRNMPNAMYPGAVVQVSGTPSASCKRFTINLSNKNEPNTNIALHFDVRFDQGVVVRNSFRQGQWGAEERQQSSMPFQRGVPFNVTILCEQNAYKVSVNNVHFIEYNHRITNLHNIKWLDISGELTLTDVSV